MRLLGRVLHIDVGMGLGACVEFVCAVFAWSLPSLHLGFWFVLARVCAFCCKIAHHMRILFRSFFQALK